MEELNIKKALGYDITISLYGSLFQCFILMMYIFNANFQTWIFSKDMESCTNNNELQTRREIRGSCFSCRLISLQLIISKAVEKININCN